MSRSATKGMKFTEKYGVETAQIYKGASGKELDALHIPPKGHPLFDPTAPTTFDEIRVQQIDGDGHMTTAIEVWTDPDKGILWVLDGRGRFLDVQEVNRRRAKEGRELVQPYIVPFHGDEKAAVARVRAKNYHRRMPTVSGMGCDILMLRKQGFSWDDCARILHVQVEDAEQWGRRLLPLAHCVPEVRAAFDSKELPISMARKFAGSSIDGEDALAPKEQLKKLEELRKVRTFVNEKENGARPRPRSTKVREKVSSALAESTSSAAKLVQATLAWIEGDDGALDSWPDVKRLVSDALAPPIPKEKSAKEKRPAKKSKAKAEARA